MGSADNADCGIWAKAQPFQQLLCPACHVPHRNA
jgi:hypothetical protein